MPILSEAMPAWSKKQSIMLYSKAAIDIIKTNMKVTSISWYREMRFPDLFLSDSFDRSSSMFLLELVANMVIHAIEKPMIMAMELIKQPEMLIA